MKKSSAHIQHAHTGKDDAFMKAATCCKGHTLMLFFALLQ
jgi:hypothetical protein